MRTLKELAVEALQIQNACNGIALANGFARAMKELNAHVKGSDELITHPITKLWIDKFASLANVQSFDIDLSKEHDLVEKLAEIKE